MNNKEILQGIANKNSNLLQKETLEMLKFEGAIDDLVTLCASEIMRYSMQNFMEGFTDRQRYILAKSIAIKSYTKAIYEMEDYFTQKKTKN